MIAARSLVLGHAAREARPFLLLIRFLWIGVPTSDGFAFGTFSALLRLVWDL
jgi:hypothetical protein